MGEAFTKNPYTIGSPNYIKVQKQIDSNSKHKKALLHPQAK